MGILWAVLACMLIPVPKELQVDYCRAVASWGYARGSVVAVYACYGDWECENVLAIGGGGYDFDRHTITIDLSYGFPADGVFLTLAHEYGHALGLSHSVEVLSIMRSGWVGPLAPGPSQADLEELRKKQLTK